MRVQMNFRRGREIRRKQTLRKRDPVRGQPDACQGQLRAVGCFSVQIEGQASSDFIQDGHLPGYLVLEAQRGKMDERCSRTRGSKSDLF